jgi:ribosomal protein L11 methyltransferase
MSSPSPQAYIEARLVVPRIHADAVGNFIIENICSGLILEEEEDTDTTGIIFYVPQPEPKDWRETLTIYLSQLVDSAMPTVPPIKERQVENIEWEEEYKKSVRPVYIGEDIVIRPPWYPPEAAIRYDIVIEPKMAFGTGRHETTRSCLYIIRKEFKPGMRFLDVGCGSGILSILADKMRAGFIKAVDTDPAAVENCRENFALNQVRTPATLAVGSIEQCAGDPPYDFVCANIIKDTILSILDELAALTTAPGILVLSGLLEHDEKEVSDSLKRRGLASFDIHRDNEWLTYVIHKG